MDEGKKMILRSAFGIGEPSHLSRGKVAIAVLSAKLGVSPGKLRKLIKSALAELKLELENQSKPENNEDSHKVHD